MKNVHSFFISEEEFCTNKEGLLKYLAEKINKGLQEEMEEGIILCSELLFSFVFRFFSATSLLWILLESGCSLWNIR